MRSGWIKRSIILCVACMLYASNGYAQSPDTQAAPQNAQVQQDNQDAQDESQNAEAKNEVPKSIYDDEKFLRIRLC